MRAEKSKIDTRSQDQIERDKARTKHAREALQDGVGPRVRGLEKDRSALAWVYRWGWSSASVIDAYASPGRRGVAARLIKRKLLEPHECEAAGGIKGVPARALTLTQDGVAEVEAFLSAEEIMPYPRDGSRLIKKHQIRHDLLVQRYTVIKLQSDNITAFQTPRELAEFATSGDKYPDAIWTFNDGKKIAVELELTAKKGRELDQALLALLRSVKDDGPYDLAVYLSHSPGLLQRYRNALKPGSKIPTYQRNPVTRQYERKAKDIDVPAWAVQRVLFEPVEL